MSGTPAQALATARERLAQLIAFQRRSFELSSNLRGSARRAALRTMDRRDDVIGELQREIRTLEIEAKVAALQPDLVQHFPAPLAEVQQ